MVRAEPAPTWAPRSCCGWIGKPPPSLPKNHTYPRGAQEFVATAILTSTLKQSTATWYALDNRSVSGASAVYQRRLVSLCHAVVGLSGRRLQSLKTVFIPGVPRKRHGTQDLDIQRNAPLFSAGSEITRSHYFSNYQRQPPWKHMYYTSTQPDDGKTTSDSLAFVSGLSM